MRPEDYERAIQEYLPTAFLKRVLTGIFTAHQLAWQDCRAAFADEEADNVLGYYRRGKVEGYLRDAATLFGELDAAVVKDPQSNWNHTEIRSGSLVLTESTVPTPCALVEKAEFRKTLARGPQGILWEEPIATDASLYVLLLHSRSRWEARDERQRYGHLPGSAYLAFPSPDLDSYLYDINLFDRFPDVVAIHMPNEWDEDAQLRYISRARKVGIA